MKKIYIFGMLILVAIVMSASVALPAYAAAWLTDPLKTNQRVEPLDGYVNALKGCKTVKGEIVGISQVQNICMREGKYASLGVSSASNRLLVKFPADSKMYPISNLTISSYNSYYVSPTADTLLFNQTAPPSFYQHVKVYKNFASTLSKSVYKGHAAYTFNPDLLHYTLKDSQGNDVKTVGSEAGYANNGRYAVISVYNKGLVRLDLDTLEQVAFSDRHRSPYDFVDFSLAVTDDGQYAALTGRSVPYRIFHINGCGSAYVNLINWSNSCNSIDVTAAFQQEVGQSSMQNMLAAFEDNDKLSLYFEASAQNWKVVSIMPESYTEGAILQYLALGDSYSSGEGDTEKNGATNEKYYRSHTDVNGEENNDIPREKCHLSARSYPYQLALWMDLAKDSPKQWDTVACSGATTYDANLDNVHGYEGQWSGEGDPGLGRLHSLANKTDLQLTALNEMIPGRVKQIEFVKQYRPETITLTMGGNDVDFAGKLDKCVKSTSTCDWASLAWRSRLKNELKDQYDNLVRLYNDLKSASDNATKIYVLGYPQFVNGSLSASCQSTFNLDSDEREMIVNSVAYYNDVIEQAANVAGVKYVDIETALGDHRLCDSGEKHVTAITNIFGWDGNEKQESFHPNAKGHVDIVNKVKQELSNESLLTYDTCLETTDLYCPDVSATKASIQDTTYFTIVNEDEDEKFTHYQLSNGEFVKSSPGNVSAVPYTYNPSSGLEVTIYSDPTSLGVLQPGADGSLGEEITIPSSVPAGYHTLVIEGETYSGEHIETYQTVLVKGADADDIDENGVLDSQQACGPFANVLNEDLDYDGVDDACDPEVTDPILYVARNGDVARGEDSNKLYLYRNTRASALTGITGDYTDISIDPNNKEALVASSLDVQAEGVFNKFVMVTDENNSAVKIPTILATDSIGVCFALRAIDLSPALDPLSLNHEPRGFTRLVQLPEDVDCE